MEQTVQALKHGSGEKLVTQLNKIMIEITEVYFYGNNI